MACYGDSFTLLTYIQLRLVPMYVHWCKSTEYHIDIAVFWVIIPWILVGKYQCSGTAHTFHIQCQSGQYNKGSSLQVLYVWSPFKSHRDIMMWKGNNVLPIKYSAILAHLLRPWRWRQQIPSKFEYIPTILKDVRNHNNKWITNAVTSQNLNEPSRTASLTVKFCIRISKTWYPNWSDLHLWQDS
jgi:hypothetical protein